MILAALFRHCCLCMLFMIMVAVIPSCCTVLMTGCNAFCLVLVPLVYHLRGALIYALFSVFTISDNLILSFLCLRLFSFHFNRFCIFFLLCYAVVMLLEVLIGTQSELNRVLEEQAKHGIYVNVS